MIGALETLASLRLKRNLNEDMNILKSVLERLSTGFRVNHAKDDAAGYSIITNIETRISSLDVVIQNAQTGIDMLATAEGGLTNINEILIRLRALAEQAANGTYSDESREAMQAEADALISQIENIKSMTEYNGVNLFSSAGQDTTNNPSTNTFSTSLSNSGRSFTPSFSFTPTPTPTPVSLESEVSTLSDPAPRDMIMDSVTLNGQASTTITIDGVEYTIKNNANNASTLTWSKDTSTGEITFNGNYFSIRGQTDVSHNLIINGRNINVYGGNLADKIVGNNYENINIYAEDGDDEIHFYGSGNIHGGDGSDTITIHEEASTTTVYGDAGDDTINTYRDNITAYGNTGNDTFNVYKGKGFTILYGNEDDDHFNIVSGNRVMVDGGAGNNTIVDNGTNTKKVNVPGANYYSVEFSANETKNVTINGIDYEVTNEASDFRSLLYQISDSGQILFMTDSFTIRGDKNKSHNVSLKARYITFYGGEKDDIILANTNNYIYGLGGNDTISGGYYCTIDAGEGDNNLTLTGGNYLASAGNGNNTIKASGSDMYITLGSGDNNINVTSGGNQNGIAANGGNNTITGDYSQYMLSGFGDLDNAEAVFFDENTTISINGIEYAVSYNKFDPHFKDNLSVMYNYNPVTGVIEFGGGGITITGEDDKAHNIELSAGRSITFYGGNLDDTIVSRIMFARIYGHDGNDHITFNHQYDYAYGGDGDDILISNGSGNIFGENGNDTLIANKDIYSMQGGSGDDIYYLYGSGNPIDTGGNNIYNIYSNNSTISGSVGQDTFYVYGNNNRVNGNGSQDYFVIDGDNNVLIGTADADSFFVDNGVDNEFQLIDPDPYSGILRFTYEGEVKELILGGKTYTITNDNAGTNELKYSMNPNTGTITLEGSIFTIDSKGDEEAVLNIRGDNNTVNGSDRDDKITIENGTNNVINGNGGNEELTTNDVNNSLIGGAGNDELNINETSDKEINGGEGNDIINVNSSNNTNIQTGEGNDKVLLTGNDNVITSGGGDNTYTVTGSNNTITAGNGNNRFSIDGNGNNITAGDGNNKIGVQGNTNTVNAGYADGMINIIGEENHITVNDGENKVVIDGNKNTFISNSGDKEIEVEGNENNITTGDGTDDYNIDGDSNIINTGDGGDRIVIEGNTNEITAGNGNNNATLRGDSNLYNGGDGVDRITISGDLNVANGGGSNDAFIVARGDTNTVDGNAGDRNTLVDNGVDTIAYNVVNITPNPFECVLQVGLDGSENSRLAISIGFNLFDFALDLSSTESASDALAQIDELIEEVNGHIVEIGAQTNRLESIIEAQTSVQQTLYASLSTIKDADIAEESARYIQTSILQNAASTLFASYNNMRRESVLSLINGIR